MIKLTAIRVSQSGLAATVSAMAGIVLTGTLLADDAAQRQSFTKRPYVTVGAGLTRIEPESSTDALDITENNDTGAHIGIGYDINRMLTLEAYAVDLGAADVEFLGTDVGSVDYQVFGISALAYLVNSRSGLSIADGDTNGLFRREGLSLYGRAGLGHMRNSSDTVEYNRDYASHAAFGLGLEYGFQNGVALRAELMGMDTDAKYLSLGVLKRFGDAHSIAAVAPVLPAVVVPESKAKPVVPEEPIAPVVPPYVYFNFDKSDLSAETKDKLDVFAKDILARDLQIVVEGHTDWIAPEQYNMSLSVRRAESVANYLESKGIDRDRMSTVGYGETRPISNNNTANGRALNRRAEFQIR